MNNKKLWLIVAIIAVVGLFSACPPEELGPVQEDLYGTWYNYEDGDELIISASELNYYVDFNGRHLAYKIQIAVWDSTDYGALSYEKAFLVGGLLANKSTTYTWIDDVVPLNENDQPASNNDTCALAIVINSDLDQIAICDDDGYPAIVFHKNQQSSPNIMLNKNTERASLRVR